jgi:hypothetical protein
MKANRVTRAAAIASLISVFYWPVTAAPVQIRTAPRPVMPNPNAPQRDVQQPQTAQYSALEFYIKTGADDLRVNSTAFADVNFKDGSNQHCSFKINGDDAWGNDSPKTLECHLDQSRTYDELRSARIWITKQDVINFLWGPDNWNINDIKVTAKDTATHVQTCVWESKGDPLIRLTGLTPKFAVEDYDTDC